jgi:hypothetical protein
VVLYGRVFPVRARDHPPNTKRKPTMSRLTGKAAIVTGAKIVIDGGYTVR